MLRGGVGGFAGRPPFAWLTNAYVGTGKVQTVLICNAPGTVPAPTTDIARLPRNCINTPAVPAPPRITYFASDFRFQQAIKYVLGLDHQLGLGFTTSLDVIHSKTRNHLHVSDVNLVERGVNAEGRVVYGRLLTSQGGVVSYPTRVDSLNFGPVYRFGNISADRSTSVAAEVEKHWTGGGQLQFGYSWSRSEDVMSLSGFNGLVILTTNPIDGSIAKRNLRRSARDIPHNLVATAVVPVRFGLTASIFFRARSGTPYAYVNNGDANADGTQGNDLAYIPRDAADVSLANPADYALLDAFIDTESCLRNQRGHIMSRNSCRNPAVQSLDLRLAKSFRTRREERLEVSADVFNLPNLLNHGSGLVRETTGREETQLLTVVGWDGAANRPRYRIPTSSGQLAVRRNGIVVDASRWRMQLGARYSF